MIYHRQYGHLSNSVWRNNLINVQFSNRYDQKTGDPGCVPDPENCHFDSYRRFVALKKKNPKFIPMISIGNILILHVEPQVQRSAIWSFFIPRYGTRDYK